MAKITRVFQKLFGSTGSGGDFGKFGSLAAGSPAFTKDPVQIQSLDAWLNGWAAETIADNRPALEDMNSLCLLAFYQICYLLQQGIPEWDTDTPYYINSIVQVSGQAYTSLTDSNTGNNPVGDLVNWTPGIGNTGVPSGVIVMWSGLIANIPSGYYFCDGTNGTPDLRDRMIIGGKQDSGGVVKTNVTGSLTQTGGEATHVLTITEIPAHTHDITTRNSNGDGATVQASDTQNQSHVVTTGSAGGNGAHNNMPPYYALALIMKS